MTWPQIFLGVLLLVTLGLFIWSSWRQDFIAWLVLIIAAVTGLVAPADVWAGLSHPAVVSVAAILVLSASLSASGVVDWAVKPLERIAKKPMLLLVGLLATATVLSAFINNVGALAILMPVAIRLAKVSGRPPSFYLMPLAFASLLGGMTTLIGTPPNLIVAGFRQQQGDAAFAMFDFALVGVPVAVVGVIFLVVLGTRLVPQRPSRVGSEELMNIAPYLTEAHVTEQSVLAGKAIEDNIPGDLRLIAVVRGQRHFAQPSAYLTIRAHDVLVLMGAGESIEKFAKDKALDIAGAQAARAASAEARKSEGEPEDSRQVNERDDDRIHLAESTDIGIAEAVVKSSAWIVGRSASSLRLRERFGLNLLALAREGARQEPRLSSIKFRGGDVLLVQGHREDLPMRIADLGCLPLTERRLSIGEGAKRLRAVLIFAAAIMVVAFGLVPAPIAFVSAVIAMILAKVLLMRHVYDAIDWPVLSLLAAMLPLGLAIESTGLAMLISSTTLKISSVMPVWLMIAVMLIATMFLSDLVNNTAAAVMMCPIAVGVATGLNAKPDPFLIAVAIGASCAFLTPIGHQSNLLVMGPGGYRFGDYWRCGLLLEVVIAIVAVPLIMLAWPIV